MLRTHRTQARRIVDALVLPDPWDIDTLIACTAAQAGRRLRVESRPAMGDGITGTIFRLAHEDVIFYREDLAGLYRDHVLCHELGHLLAGHLEGPEAYRPGSDDDLAHAFAVMMQRQCQYGEARERTAEEIAELILARVRQQIRGVRDLSTERSVRGFGAAMR